MELYESIQEIVYEDHICPIYGAYTNYIVNAFYYIRTF